ncbi:MAG: cell division ATP-binding protein FtsE [Candidatus Eremiobacter antarcticus]|nr:cell division ATP-binding protein FtsE [Candidatus Eremiobacteraeota bacterium]PZR60911.1 MAG: cell division ATP-binding protein FtsE [Candidatus Eremiobacter sp. RRmetagenome_bin22]
MIVFRDVSLVYPNGVHALSDVSLSITRGDFMFLVGSTGQGKTSLLKCINREVRPTEGEITVEGQSLAELRAGDIPFLRRKVGVVFQDFKLLHQKTVWENVAYALQVTGAGSRDVLRRVPRTLELVGIAHKSKMFPQELSGGEQQRAAIARALVNHPLILLCDEPTGNLDPETSSEIMALLARINAKGTTMLVATHNQAVVDRMRKRVVRLVNGRITRDEERGRYHVGLG